MMATTKLCPYCKEKIKADAIKCRHCGSVLIQNVSIPLTPTDTITPIKEVLVDKYEIKEIIGRGGMASVYKAIQKNLDKIVALKVIHHSLVQNKEFLDRFIREAKISASLNHTNIVQTYDVGNEESAYYISMEYLDGEDLHHMIQRKGKLSEEETIGYISPIAQALDHAHKKGIIHRDIKSSNIIVTEQGRPVLTDFGIAYAANATNLTLTGSIIGTPEYMSPEQADGRDVDNRSDLYSLGVVMYECLTGTVPYKGEYSLVIIYKIINSEHQSARELNPEVSLWLNNILEKLISKHPEDRYKTGQELVEALKNKIEDLSILDTSSDQSSQKIDVNRVEPKKRLSQRNKAFYTIAFALILILGMLAYLFLKPGVFKTSSNKDFSKNGNKPTIEKSKESDTNEKNQITSTENQALNELKKDYAKAYDTAKHLLELNPGNKVANEILGKIKAQLIDKAENYYSSRDWSLALSTYLEIQKKFGDSKKNSSKITLCKEEIEKNSYVIVPDLIGINLDAAKTSLQKIGLVLGAVSKLPRPGSESNTIIRQVPIAGARVKKGISVNLIVGK